MKKPLTPDRIRRWTTEREQLVRTRISALPEITMGLSGMSIINLAVTGTASDARPACMSRVVHTFLTRMDQVVPSDGPEMQEWRALLPTAPGASTWREKRHLDLVRDWMWGVMAYIQPVADESGFGEEWWQMVIERSYFAAHVAWFAAMDLDADPPALHAYLAAMYAKRAVVRGGARDAAAANAVSAVCAALDAAQTIDVGEGGTWGMDRWGLVDPSMLLRDLIDA